MAQSFPVVYYGTPEFSIPPLRALLNTGFDIRAVVTVPDKPAGRGLQVKRSALGLFATANNIPLLMPAELTDEVFLSELKQIKPAVQVVVAFRKLPEAVWALPKIGTINLHASLLPQYRGAAPINWVIINGEKESGVSTFFINHNIDTGDIIMQERIKLDENETAGSLHDKLSLLGAELLVRTLSALREGIFPRIEQDLSVSVKKAPKLSKDICRINWFMELTSLYNFIRGLSPYPAAWTTLNGKVLKIFSSEAIPAKHQLKTGSVHTDFKNFLHIAVTGGYISALEIQLEGRSRMQIKEFLRGLPNQNNLQIQ